MGVFCFSVFRCRRCVVISRCLPTLFSTEKSSLLISLEILVPFMRIVPSPVILQRIIPIISVPASIIAVIVVLSSVGISLTALRSITVVSPGSLFFRVLSITWFYVPNRCCLSVKLVVLTSVCHVCTRVAYHALRSHGAVDR